MTDSQKQTVLITGASSGIGADLARVFASNGHDVALVARSEDKLNQLAEKLHQEHGIQTYVLVKDLTLPQGPSEIYQELLDRSIRIDIVVNNAGFGGHGRFYQTELDHELRMIQLNITALTELTKLFGSEMVKRGEGRILNVASTAGFQPGPLMAVYYATKAYVLSFSEAVAEEMRGTGVTVTTLCPGATKTPFQGIANVQDTFLFKRLSMQSEEVAKQGYQALMKGKRLIVTGWLNKTLAFSTRISPRWLALKIVRMLMNERGS